MSEKKLRILFIGTSSEYSLKPLEAIAEQHQLVCIVESAPRKKNTHGFFEYIRSVQHNRLTQGRLSLQFYAWKNKLPYLLLSHQNTDALREMIRSTQPHIGCVASMNQMIPADILQLPSCGFINFHPSLLPRYRGPFVWFWYYYAFEKEAGATIHYLDEGEDTGDIIRQASFDIETGMPPEDLVERTISLGSELMVAALQDIASGEVIRKKQRHLPCPDRARYLKEGEELFDWQNWSLEHAFHFMNGVYPWYEPLKKPAFVPSLYRWRACGYEANDFSSRLPGKIMFDKNGFYFSHPHGKIRLKLILDLHWLALLALLLLAILNILLNQ